MKRGIQARTGDEESYLWFETYRPARCQTRLDGRNTGLLLGGDWASPEGDEAHDGAVPAILDSLAALYEGP